MDPAPDDERNGGFLRRFRSIGLVARILIFAAVLHFLVLPQIGGTRQALGLLGDLEPLFLVGALAFEIAALGAYAQLTRSLLPADVRPSLWRMFRVVLASLAVSHVVPGGAAAGGVLQYRLLTASGAAAPQATFAMATQSLGSAVVLNVLLWVGLIVSIPAQGFQPLYATAAIVGAVLLTIAAAAVIGLTRGRRTVAGAVRRIADRTPRLDADRVVEVFERVAAQLGALMAQPRLAVTAIAWAAANWILDATVLWLFLAAFGHRTSIPGLIVAYGLANVLAAIPISPGGLGVIETTLIVTLVGFDTPRATASLGVAAYRLVQFWAPIPSGAIAWVSLMGGSGRDAFARMGDESRREDGPQW